MLQKTSLSLLIVAIVTAFFSPVALAEPAVFMVGRAQANITPPLGVGLAGYFHERIAERVLDELYAKAVVIKSGDAAIAIVSLDLICVTEELTAAARELIAGETGIPPTHVMVCATHTHTGPEIRSGRSSSRDNSYVEDLPRKIADAVNAAADSAVPSTLRCGTVEVTGYSFNRLFRQRDGSEVFGRRQDELAPAGPIDPELQTLSAVDMDGNLIALMVNFALHPDVIGGGRADFVSADWCGMIGDTIGRVYGPDVVTLLLQGTCGDINHNPHEPTFLPRRGPEKALQLGRALAGAAMVALERAEPMTNSGLDAVNKTLKVPYFTRTEQFMEEIEQLKKKENPTNQERSLIRRAEAWPHDNELAEVPLQAFRIGDLSMVGLPSEIFVRIGLEIKEWSPTERTFVVELANARVSSYIPTTDQAERGAYGARAILSRALESDAGRQITDASIVMLHQLDD